MDAEFVEDVTFPDGSHVQPGTKFVKRWLLMNTGTHAWSASTKVMSICQELFIDKNLDYTGKIRRRGDKENMEIVLNICYIKKYLAFLRTFIDKIDSLV